MSPPRALPTLVQDRGSGPPLLLLHGVMVHAVTWRLLVEPLAATHRVITVDWPGCGSAPKDPAVTRDTRSLAAGAAALLDQLGLEQATIVGHSLGAVVALRLALDHPSQVQRLVLLAPATFPRKSQRVLHRALGVGAVRRLGAAALRAKRERVMRASLRYHGRSCTAEEVATYGAPLGEPGGAECMLDLAASVFRPAELSALVDELRARPPAMPALVLGAWGDPLVAPLGVQRHAGLLPNARVCFIDDAGHALHVDQPARVLQAMQHFLAAT